MITKESLIEALKLSLAKRFEAMALTLPQTADGMGQLIGSAVRDDLNQIQSLGYLPVGVRWKEVYVDFNRFEAWPQYQVIVRWL